MVIPSRADSLSPLYSFMNTGALTPITGPPFSAGRNPIFVAVDPSGKFAYVANHADGTISGYTISPVTRALRLHSLLDNLRKRTEKFRSSRLECTNARSPDRIGRPRHARLAPALRRQSRADSSATSLPSGGEINRQRKIKSEKKSDNNRNASRHDTGSQRPRWGGH